MGSKFFGTPHHPIDALTNGTPTPIGSGVVDQVGRGHVVGVGRQNSSLAEAESAYDSSDRWHGAFHPGPQGTRSASDSTITGTSGNDNIVGTVDDDVIHAGAGDDQVDGGAGADRISGEDGNDHLTGNFGNDTMMGGNGNDYIYDSSGTNSVSGGAGDDFINLDGGSGSVVNGNAGNDSLLIYSAATTVSGGEGQDYFIIAQGYAGCEIADFQSGDGGDVLSISQVIANEPGYDGSNPFGAGYIKLVQSAADTLVEYGSGDNYTTLVKLDNVDSSTLSSANFNPGFDPGGGTSPGHAYLGTDSSDGITGTVGDDTVNAGAGDDQVDGDAGADRISGEDGNDHLTGNFGNDTMMGGNGNDYIYDSSGTNSVSGGAGDDFINLDGGSGSVVNGNAGNDSLLIYSAATTVSGGEGQDYFIIAQGYAGCEIADFQSGDGGDVLSISQVIANEPGYDGSNPFGAGYIKLVQSAADTLVEYGSGDNYTTLVKLDNVDSSTLSSANFNPGFDPGGGTSPGHAYLGTDSSDGITGTVGDDTVNAGAGDDQVDGDAGADRISGEDGNDHLTGNFGNDTMMGGNGNDYIYDSSGTNSVSGGAGDDFIDLDGGSGSVVNGNAGNDSLLIYSAATTVSGGEGQDYFIIAQGYAGCEIADFQSGDGGDVLSISQVIANEPGYDGSNPFGTGYIKLVQSAADTLVEYGSGDNYTTLVKLDNVDSSTLSSANFNPGFGTPNDDTIMGTAQADTIDALGGDDVVTSGEGDDSVNGGSGADTIESGLGTDTVHGGDGDDVILGSSIDSVASTQNNSDFVSDSGDREDVFDGGSGSNTISYAAAATGVSLSLAGGTASGQEIGTDQIADFQNAIGGAGADTLRGNSSDNILDGGQGSDTLIGGQGDDTYKVDAKTDLITETLNEGKDTVLSSSTYALSANVENLTLLAGGPLTGTGNNLANLITANDSGANLNGVTGNDILVGGHGDDTLNGGIGVDSMSGGAGNDFYMVDNVGDVVREAFNAGLDTVRSSVSFTLGANIENLSLTRSADSTGIGNGLNNEIDGNSGANRLQGAAGTDTLNGGAGNDTLDGGALSDVLDGGVGADSMMGGVGNDTYTVDNVGDVVVEFSTAGIDTVQTAMTYTLGANLENLTLTGTGQVIATGNSLDNVLRGNTKDNTLVGGLGNDTLSGGHGNDTASFADASGGVRVDLSNSAAQNTGIDGTDTLTGIEHLIGSDFADMLTGGNKANHISGGAGADTITGGHGTDLLTGGADGDTFRFNNVLDSRSANPDRITDLRAGDTVELHQIDANTSTVGDDPFHIVAAFTKHAGELVISYDSATNQTSVEGDVNGDKHADFTLLLDGDQTGFTGYVL